MQDELGSPLNIDRLLGKAKNRINLVGVELEGGWYKLPGELKPQRDGSVSFNDSDPYEKVVLIKHIGEIPLPPLGVKEFPATMKLYYPSYVNKTCGMHVHLSTNKAFSYQRLMVNRPFSYPATIVEYISRWAKAEKLPKAHPIWPRLENKNEYCQHLFQAEEQIKTTEKDFNHSRVGHRYTVIGYCWSRYRTVECRLLPMMETAEQGIRAVQEIISITNAFLAISKEREPKLKSQVNEDDLEVNERRSYV